MNFNLKDMPARTPKPRETGLTMVMDKGMSIQETENFISVAGPYVDLVKLGFGTAYLLPNLEKKLEVYRAANIPVYFGGTLFEAFIVRNQFDDYLKILEKYKLEYAEVSDGSLEMNHTDKLNYISTLSKHVKVLSEVGSKDATKIMPPYKWIELIKAELGAGSWKVIAEAREGGNVGIYRDSGEVRQGLVEEILSQVPGEKILWEAPNNAQQVWFIKLLGANVNLGNIAPNEVIPLETLRIGLRGDTFHFFLKK